MRKIILASSNRGKIAEIRELFLPLSIELIAQSDMNVIDAEETGVTFIENALIKARHAAFHTNLPALADDSGLVVEALNGAPGVLSSRYAGNKAEDKDRIQKLLTELEKTNNPNRRAHFYCVLALVRYPEDPAPLIAQGVWSGEILAEPRGNLGFGYDPIFYVPEYRCSAGELDPLLKNKISHRGRAFQIFLELFSSSPGMLTNGLY